MLWIFKQETSLGTVNPEIIFKTNCKHHTTAKRRFKKQYSDSKPVKLYRMLGDMEQFWETIYFGLLRT